MGPIRATTTCLRKAFDFSGRATREEFWWFAPIGFLLPFLVSFYTPPTVRDTSTFGIKLAITLVFFLPFVSAVTRRYHDIGIDAGEFWRGIAPTLGALVCLFFIAFGIFAIATIWGALIGVMIVVPFGLLLLWSVLRAPWALFRTIRQLLLPSAPPLNQYGPNPHEVSP